MSRIFDVIEGRFTAIACQGYGATGLGAVAARHSIPPGRFRPSLHGAELDDPGYDTAAFDRAVRWAWVSTGDEPNPTNDVDPTAIRIARVDLTVGYLYGDALKNFVSAASGTSEDAATAVREVRVRALSDAERIRRALGWYELRAGTDPAIIDVWRDSDSALRDLTGGRMLCVTRYRITYQLNTDSDYDP